MLKRLRALDLRFCDAEEELAFKRSRESGLRCGLLGACLISLAVSVSGTLGAYMEETGRTDNPYAWAVSDPRSLLFGVSLAIDLMVLCLIIILMLGRSCGSLRFDFELLGTAVAVGIELLLPGTSGWHIAKLYGKEPLEVWKISHPSHRGDNYAVLVLQVLAMASMALYVPIRCHFMIWIQLAAAASYITLVACLGAPDPSSDAVVFTTIIMLSFCFVCFHGAWRQESFARERFKAVRDADLSVEKKAMELEESAAVAKGMECVATLLCDFVVPLSEDLHVAVCSMAAESFFGNVTSEPFESLLHQEDRERFCAACRRCEERLEPQSVPGKVRGLAGETVAQLLVVFTGRERHHFLIGVKLEEQFVPVVQAPMMASSRSSRLPRVVEESSLGYSDSASDSEFWSPRSSEVSWISSRGTAARAPVHPEPAERAASGLLSI